MNNHDNERRDAAGRLVSIVIPVYNGSSYVAQAIDSALAQTWPWIEVIVVDDGSDDGGATQRIVSGYGNAVRFIRKPNGGVGSALNVGIAAMRGDWFSWLSHDDLYLPTKIERYMEALEGALPQAIAFGEVDLVDEQSHLLGCAGLLNSLVTDESDPRWLVMEGRLNGCAMLIPRACLAATEPFNPQLPTTQDYALWFELAGRFPFVAVREPLVRSRRHGEQHSRHKRHLEEAGLLWLRMIEHMEHDTPARSPLEDLQRLRRMQRFLRHTTYQGAQAYIDRRLREHPHVADVALVCRADTIEQLGQALAQVSAAGVPCSEILVIDGTEDAAAARRWSMTRMAPRLQVLRLPLRFANPGEVLTVALERTQAPVLAIVDALRIIDVPQLAEGLKTIMAEEGDAWLASSAEPSALGALHGAILRRAAVSEVMAGGPEAYPMLGLHARIIAAYAPPRPCALAPESCAPQPRARGRLPTPPALERMPRPERPTLLILVHAWGGGTIRYAETVAATIGGRANVLFGWGREGTVFVLSSLGPEQGEFCYDLPSQMKELVHDLHTLGVARVDVMHTIGMDDHVDEFLSRLGVPFDLTLLDYHQMATHPHLLDERGAFVGDAALRRLDHPLLRPNPGARLRVAERVIACSRDLAARTCRLSGVRDVVPVRVPEPGNPERYALHAASLGADEWMRVLFLGNMAPHKGTSLLTEVASQLQSREIPILIECLGAIGSALPVGALRNPHLRIWGRYESDDLHGLVCEIRPHLAWLPFFAPETHSFALSDVLLQGLPILASGVGAIAERLQGRPATWILTMQESTPEGITTWLDRLRRERLTTRPRWLPTDHLPRLRDRFYADEYVRPLYAHT